MVEDRTKRQRKGVVIIRWNEKQGTDLVECIRYQKDDILLKLAKIKATATKWDEVNEQETALGRGYCMCGRPATRPDVRMYGCRHA